MALGSNAAAARNAATGRSSARTGSRRKGAEGTGRSSVRERVRGSGLLSVPASLMGPRLLFVLAFVVLSALGLVMIYSASSVTAYSEYHNASYYLDRQAVFLVAGAVLCVVLAKVPYRFWARPAVFTVLWLATCALLVLTATGHGVEANGAERSVHIVGALSVQPSEFAKLTVLLAVASLLEMCREHTMPYKRFFILAVVAVVVPVLLMAKQPDLGSALVMLFGVVAMLVLVGTRWRWIVAIVAAAAVFVVVICVVQPYHQDRFIAAYAPWSDPQGLGFHLIQSLYAFGSGGIFGTGLGLSRQKYLYLPEAHTEFIFSIIGEELGLVGTLAVIALFAVFVYAGLRIARSAPDLFGCLVAGGLTAMIGFQACVNMGQTCGVVPVTGKALPFLSYGGSSVVATLAMCGIVLSVSLGSKVGAAHERRRDDLRVYEGGKSRAGGTEPQGRASGQGTSRHRKDRRPARGREAASASGRQGGAQVIPLHAERTSAQRRHSGQGRSEKGLREDGRPESGEGGTGAFRYGQSVYARRRGHHRDDGM